METLDLLSDEETVQGLRAGISDLEAGRTHTYEEVFGHPLGEAPKE